ncbi:hypothetical protein PPSIR1_07752 [Plesiocystis pacifica SIR-1]|uniref:Uncharacterized protein n=1 Tax=Plesiocystis pacifica SIR-1 TaxID=391625 RepID=A6GCU5_9BACT|nr:hypothetical protein [Plesiocystis pacifica]EDM76269.1 hypothetical protein PPSIR1_07752 [Plesiocystis pacifica SIR-1]
MGCERANSVEAEAQANSKRVTASSTNDATEPIVDVDFGFRIDHPGEGWKLLGEADVKQFNPDAEAGMLHDSGLLCIVIVSRTPDMGLEAAAEFVGQQKFPKQVIESSRDVETSGVPGKQHIFTAEVGGVAYRYESTVYYRQDHVYQVLSSTLASKPASDLDSSQDTFAFLDGEVRGRQIIAPRIERYDGVGARVRDGRFESGVSGLQIEPPEGWGILVGSQRERIHPDSEVVFSLGKDAFVAITTETVSTDGQAGMVGFLRTRGGELFGEARGEGQTHELAGIPVSFQTYRSDPFEYQHGVFSHGSAVIQVSSWYTVPLADELRPSVEALYAAFTSIPGDERERLVRSLRETPAQQRRFEPDRSYWGGTFRDFANDLSWRCPQGMWGVDSFDAAREQRPDAVLQAQNIEASVMVSLEVWAADGASPADILDRELEGRELVSRSTASVDGVPVQRGLSSGRVNGVEFRYATLVAVHHGQNVLMEAWTANPGAVQDEAMARALANLRFHDRLEPVETLGRTRVDRLFGRRFEIPAGFELSQSELVGSERVEVWKSGRRELTAWSLSFVNGLQEESWIYDFIEQNARDRISALGRFGAPERSEVEISGRKGRHLRWSAAGGLSRVEADFLVHELTVFAFVYSNFSEAEMAEVRRSQQL